MLGCVYSVRAVGEAPFTLEMGCTHLSHAGVSI